MDKEELLQKKAALEKRFEEFNSEIMRIQGEHRLVVELLGKLEEGVPIEVKTPKRMRKVVEVDAKD